MYINVAALASHFGYRLNRTLRVRDDRAVAQVRDGTGHLFTLKADAEAEALAGDIAAIAVLGTAGLPVPEVITYQAGPPAVVILRWIDGDPISSAAPLSVQREAGQLLRAVHGLSGGPPFSGQPSVSDWIAGWTAEVASWWPTVGGTTQQVAHLTTWLAELSPTLHNRAGTLTLFDGRAEHFLIRGGRVAGLIDLHDVGPGDPAMDLAVLALTDEDLLPAVLEGYAASRHEQDDLARLIPFYLLLRRLAGAEWHLRLGSEAEGRMLLELAAGGPHEIKHRDRGRT